MEHNDPTERLRRLRKSDPDDVEDRKNFYLESASLFHRLMLEDGVRTDDQIRIIARRAIRAICIFEDEWAIAAMSPDGAEMRERETVKHDSQDA